MRSIIGLCFLISLLTTGSFLLSKLQVFRNISTKSGTGKTTNSGNSNIFYNQIGKTPIGFDRKGEPDLRKKTLFTVEVKKADTQQEAERIVQFMSSMDIQAYYSPIQIDTHVFFAIRTGHFQNKTDAIKLQTKLASTHQVASQVVALH